MVAEIDTLINAITDFLEEKKPIAAIEEATTPFIIDDGNMLKDKKLSEIVYMLDMHDIENLSRKEIIELRNELIAYRHTLD
ncbi:MAG TPA: hypothetical protein VI322_01495 [Candidatus Saccharimonadia bacterium]